MLTENDLVNRIKEAFAKRPGSRLDLGMGDDAALFKPKAGDEIVLTCDWFVEGSHFLRDKHPAEAVGWKCLARAISDIAAMGGTPRCFLLSLALPEDATGKWLTEFLRGLRSAGRELECELAGGDTTRRDEILISITIVGEVRAGRALRREGARPGDQLFATGTLGVAQLGLEMLREGKGMARPVNPSLRKHLYPVPRLRVGRWLAEKRLASAMMDLSDGLSTDLERLCRASGVGARIEAAGLPICSAVGRADGLKLALHGGDDYELLFTVDPKIAKRLPSAYRRVKITRIGEILAGEKIFVEDGGGTRVLKRRGWDPFAKT